VESVILYTPVWAYGVFSDSSYTPCPEKRGHCFFLHSFNKCRHSFVIFVMNHPEDLSHDYT